LGGACSPQAVRMVARSNRAGGIVVGGPWGEPAPPKLFARSPVRIGPGIEKFNKWGGERYWGGGRRDPWGWAWVAALVGIELRVAGKAWV
ncbi:MAG: hypothetical protein ACRDK7_14550, partial [Solirubrobacteraceae bacterium]